MSRHEIGEEVRLAHRRGSSKEIIHIDKAILPVGATEYHGPHLPYGTDAFTAEAIAETFARELGRCLVLPTLFYGVSHHHMSWPWTITLRPDTLANVIHDIGSSLVDHGVKKLLIVSAHDRNHPAANVAADQLAMEHGLTVAVFSGWQRKAREALKGRYDIDLDHGGQSEMSIMMYVAPETTDIAAATAAPRQSSGHPVDLVGPFADAVPRGYSGNAAAGSAEEGEAIMAALSAMVVPFLRELDKNGWTDGDWLGGTG